VIDYAPVDGRKVVAITAEIQDMEGLIAMAAPEMKAMERENGVIHPISVFIEG
jgi:hypothetical protein